MNIDEILAHHGVKGMKWGVRRAQKKGARADKKWKKNITSVRGAIAVHNAGASYFNDRIAGINDKHGAADLIGKPDSPASRAYIKDVEALTDKAYANAVLTVHGKSPTGRYSAHYKNDANGQRIEVIDSEQVKHADDSAAMVFDVDIVDGKIVGVKPAESEMEQSSMTFDEVLAHYGVKGMKWGQRKARGAGGSSGTDRTRYTKAPSKLSTAELTRRINRMEAERKYNKLNRDDISEGRKAVNEVLSSSGKKVASTALTGATLLAIKTLVTAKFGSSAGNMVTKRGK